MKTTNFLENFINFNQTPPVIAVLGDVMIDRYLKGHVRRLAPEAPIPILSEMVVTDKIGAAGFVASVLAELGADTHFFGLTGADENGVHLKNLLAAKKIKTDGLIADPSRPTSLKQRFMEGDKLLFRADDEKTHEIDKQLAAIIFEKIFALSNLSLIVISDYAKGITPVFLLQKIIEQAKTKNIPVLIDPKGSDWNKYKGATLITPNMKELSEAYGETLNANNFENAAKKLIEKFELTALLVTRSEDGMSYVDLNKTHNQISFAKDIKTVIGAGDQVIAVLALGITQNKPIEEILNVASLKAAAHIEGRE